MKKNKVENSNAITLIALVVTIVVLLILAGITISYVMGGNSIFKEASEAKLQTDIAQWKERLELAKSPIFVEGLGTFDVDKYFDYIWQQGIINNRETDVVDNEDGTYDVTTKPGYIFEVALIPTSERPTDAEITYIGQEGKILPIIKKLEVSATSTSITGKATVSRLGNGTIQYYYKLKTENDSEYKEITNVNAETGATQSTEIIAGESYIIKVVAKNDIGEVELTKEIAATKVFVNSITLNKTAETIKVGSTLTLLVTVKPDDSTNKNVTWESSNTAVATVNSTGVITGKTVGTTTITVKATDGSNKSATCEITVIGITETIELNSVRARIATGYTRWLDAVATPSNASQEFEWTSSNINVATVDSTGKVMAKTPGTTTITVKTKDGTNLSKTCSVTVATGVDVTTLTSIQSSNKVARDSNGNLITVPGGFKVLTSEATNVTQGIVIQDSEGNEFVWIPVDSVSTGTTKPADDIRLGRYTFDSNGIPKKGQDADQYPYRVQLFFYCELTSDSGNTAAKNLKDFVTNTKSNGGYYIGRYEASKGDDGKVDSKVNKTPWVWITQPQAASAARDMYNSSYVESDLINSYSWDTAIVFIQKYSGNTNYANKTSVNSNKMNTGISEDKVCNIYDIASNCFEFDTEWCNSATGYFCVVRGGCYTTTFTEVSVSCDRDGGKDSRHINTPTGSSPFDSFRPILYLK